MTQEQYYTAPSQEIFEEIKKASIEIWNTYSDEFGYRSEKIDSIKDLKNIKDNAWYMVAMFDQSNQLKLLVKVSEETGRMIMDAMST